MGVGEGREGILSVGVPAWTRASAAARQLGIGHWPFGIGHGYEIAVAMGEIGV